MIEVVAVLVVIGIVAAVAVSRVGSNEIGLLTQAEAVKAHLRYAQVRALNTNSVWYVRFDTGSSYSLYKADVPHSFLGQDTPTISLPAGLSANYGSSNVVAFDSWGRPCLDAAAQTLQAADRVLTVSDGSHDVRITITRNTGYIP